MALSVSIPYLYLLAIAANSFSVSAMVVSMRVGMRVVVGLKKSGLESRLRLRLRSRLRLRLRLRSRSRSRVVYTFSTAIRPVKCSLARLLFSQRSVVLAVRPVQILSSFGRS